jgi:hypothetical protein
MLIKFMFTGAGIQFANAEHKMGLIIYENNGRLRKTLHAG